MMDPILLYILIAFGIANSIVMLLFIRAGLFQPMPPLQAPFYQSEQKEKEGA